MPDIYQQQQNLLAQQQAQAKAAIESARPTQQQLRAGTVSSMLQRQATAQNVTALREFLGKAETAQVQLKEAQELTKIQSPEFQQSAYNEALRILRSGWGRAGLPDNPDAFSQAVKSYYYQIEKGLPRSYAVDKAGNVFTEKTVEVPAPPTQEISSPQYDSFSFLRAQQLKATAPAEYLNLAATAIQAQQAKQQQVIPAKTGLFSVSPDIYWKVSDFLTKMDKSLGFSETTPTFSVLAKTKGPAGIVFKGAEQVAKGVSLIAQKAGEPKVAAEQLGEQVASTALFTVFSPLFSTFVAKKGTKQVTVEKEAAKETSKKVSKPEVITQIQENVIRNPSANREIVKQILQKAIETKNPEYIKQYANLFKEALGDVAARNLFSDVASQEGLIVPRVPTVQPTGPSIFFEPQTFRPEITQSPLGILAPITKISAKTGQKEKQEQKPAIALKLSPNVITTQIPKTEIVQIPLMKSISAQTPALESISLQLPQLKSESQTAQVSISQTIQTPRFQSPAFNIPELAGGLFKGLKEEKRRKTRKAFRVQIKRKGMFMDIGKLLPRGKALKAGAEITKATLAAQFRIIPSKTEIIAEDISYLPEPKIFRSYQIRKGKRIPMLDTFIQRRGTRLGTRSEVSEIQMFKKAKQRRFRLI